MKKKPKGQKLPTASKRTPSLKASTSLTESHSKWIRIDRPFPLPGYVKEAIQALDEAGYVGYVVGGSVRDFLLGRETKDHDIATDAGPNELCKLFPDAVTVGKAYGVIKVPVKGSNVLLEIATFREDLEYKDFRHPKGVKFAGPIEDAKRRDFTVNAFFFDPKTSRILDTTGGMDDLKAQMIRAIGDPSERFREDALRLLRAVRFTAQLGFTLDPATSEAVRARAKLITKVSAERIRDELTLMWKGPRPAQALELLSDLGLLSHILPEMDAVRAISKTLPFLNYPEGDAWTHTLKVLEHLARQNPVRTSSLAWSAVLIDVGKPVAARRSGGKSFNGQELDGGKLARSIGDRMRMPKDDIHQIAALVEDHLKFSGVFQMRESTLQRFIREPYFEELLALHKADATASDGNLAYHEFCASRLESMKAVPSAVAEKLIDGNDLIQLGFHPGPEFSRILRTVEDLSMERKLLTKEEALEYVVKHFVR